MSDLAERILSAVQVMETVAQSKLDIRHLYAPERVEELEGVLRRCAADREIVEIAKYHIENLKIHRVNGAPILTTDEATAALMTRMLQVLARGYGIQP